MDQNQKDFLTAVIPALITALFPFLSGLIIWLEKRSKGSQEDDAIKSARKQTAFLSEWLKVRELSASSRTIPSIKLTVAKELDDIRMRVDKIVNLKHEQPLDASPNLSSYSVTFYRIRQYIGLFGVALPFLLSVNAYLLFNIGIQSTLSAYYYTGMRNVFIGVFVALGILLIVYEGYGFADRIAGSLAGISAIGVAIFPTPPPGVVVTSSMLYVGYFHFAFFLLFFLTLAYYSLFLFTRSNSDGKPTARKLQRNLVYRTCGYTMLICTLLSLAYMVIQYSIYISPTAFQPVFWLESLNFFAFGLSWLTKGQLFLR